MSPTTGTPTTGAHDARHAHHAHHGRRLARLGLLAAMVSRLLGRLVGIVLVVLLARKASTDTVAVRPGRSCTPFGTWSTLTRTGMRWARRTHEKVGLKLARRLVASLRPVSPMPPAMLATRPMSTPSSPISWTLTGAPTRMRGSLVSSK